MAIVAIAAWAATLTLQSPPPAAQFVRLTPPDEPDVAAAAGAVSPAGPLQLDVRLVRGYDGVRPPDVRTAQALGVGGADALRDVRTRIESLLPFDLWGRLRPPKMIA